MREFYFYLHANGQLIVKNVRAVEADPKYFDSPFVRKVWKIDLDDREQAEKMLAEANEMRGGKLGRLVYDKEYGFTEEQERSKNG